MKNNFAKWKPYIFLAILLLSLIPLIWLGRYNYPTGDDYYYGAETHLVWQQTGSIIQTLDAACAGVADSYQIWQGTYSALFLMYLAPNVFSNTAYHLVTFVILLLLCGGIFYLLCPLFRRFLPGTCGEWITVSSILSFLCIQTVEFQCDSFYWYNGSMYYTGFFAVTLFFLGTLFRYLDNGKRILLLPLLLFAVFLGGGNYVSLLPCMLLSVTITLLLLLQKNKKAYICGITSVVLLLSFAVSAIAPGNHVRQSGMWKIPAWKAIAKCLLQGIRYTFAWTGLWWVLAALLLLPLGVMCLRAGQDWFLTAALGVLLGTAVVLLPFVMRQVPLPKELERHRAFVYLAVVTVLLSALIASCRLRYLWSEAYPLTAVGLLYPWLMLVCLRYIPLSRCLRASAACAVTALYIWLAPWAVDGIITANGWVSTAPYDPLHPYYVDFSDWVSAPALGGNIMVTIMLALALAAIILAALGVKNRARDKTPPEG